MERNCGVQPRRAFTLVEMLVVISVLAVIIAIALPTLSGARDAAQSTKCLTSVRTLLFATEAYRSNERGLYPVATRAADLRTDYTEPFASLADYLEVKLPTRIDGKPVQPFACIADKAGIPHAGFSYLYRPYDLFALWPDPEPQVAVSRLLESAVKEVIFREGEARHRGRMRTDGINDGSVRLVKEPAVVR